MRHGFLLAALLLLAGCGGTGNWQKPGADPAATSREYQDCRDLAGSAVETQANIDQDIQATRQSDTQRSSILRTDAQSMRDQTGDRAGAIIESCMRAKGFAQPR